MRLIILNRGRVRVSLLFLTLILAVVWFARRSSVHPQFGQVYEAQMSESYNDTRRLWQLRHDAEASVRGFLHLRQQRPPPARSDHGPNSDYGLRVGPSLLGWSSHDNSFTNRNGYIYMRDERPTGGNRPLWEFALSAKHRLSEVTRDDLRCEFYGMDDPRGAEVFGGAWEDGAAIFVPEGQIFFARLVADRSVIYIIRLAKQGGAQSGRGAMRIEYTTATNQPLSERSGMDASRASRLLIESYRPGTTPTGG
jgi:hypothetical protein